LSPRESASHGLGAAGRSVFNAADLLELFRRNAERREMLIQTTYSLQSIEAVLSEGQSTFARPWPAIDVSRRRTSLISSS
jgi:hypothetical protein